MVNIDWSVASDDQLSELYDALAARNHLIGEAMGDIRFSVSIGTVWKRLHDIRSEIAGISCELAESVMEEIKKRHIEVWG